jgi:hypothetical protein
MEDLDNRLVGLGYRQVRREPDCWRVTQIGVSAATCGREGSRRRDPASSRALRLWLDRLVDLERPTPYRICGCREG